MLYNGQLIACFRPKKIEIKLHILSYENIIEMSTLYSLSLLYIW